MLACSLSTPCSKAESVQDDQQVNSEMLCLKAERSHVLFVWFWSGLKTSCKLVYMKS